jgi:hypothetical protein
MSHPQRSPCGYADWAVLVNADFSALVVAEMATDLLNVAN